MLKSCPAKSKVDLSIAHQLSLWSGRPQHHTKIKKSFGVETELRKESCKLCHHGNIILKIYDDGGIDVMR